MKSYLNKIINLIKRKFVQDTSQEFERSRKNSDFQSNIKLETPFQSYLYNFLNEDFVLLDIGCSGGINKNFIDVFKKKLKAIGFDSNIEEINHLNNINSNSKIKYHKGIVKFSSSSVKSKWKDNLRVQSGLGRSILSKSNFKKMNLSEIQQNNFYNLTHASTNIIDIKSYCKQNKINYVDFIKIDLDGLDYLFLDEIDDLPNQINILGVFIEQMYDNDIRSGLFVDDVNSDSLPNYLSIGQKMHALNFSLFDFSHHKYESSVIPGRSIYNFQSQNIYGRIIAGDALYLRDPLNKRKKKYKINHNKLIKLMMLYDMHCKSSWAAEILISKRKFMESIGIDVEHCLNLITEDSLKENEIKFLSKNKYKLHKEYLEAFKKDPTITYPS